MYFKRLITSWSVSLEAFKMYYVMRASAPSLERVYGLSDIICKYRHNKSCMHVVLNELRLGLVTHVTGELKCHVENVWNVVI